MARLQSPLVPVAYGNHSSEPRGRKRGWVGEGWQEVLLVLSIPSVLCVELGAHCEESISGQVGRARCMLEHTAIALTPMGSGRVARV
jgi:hypothetical protein